MICIFCKSHMSALYGGDGDPDKYVCTGCHSTLHAGIEATGDWSDSDPDYCDGMVCDMGDFYGHAYVWTFDDTPQLTCPACDGDPWADDELCEICMSNFGKVTKWFVQEIISFNKLCRSLIKFVGEREVFDDTPLTQLWAETRELVALVDLLGLHHGINDYELRYKLGFELKEEEL